MDQFTRRMVGFGVQGGIVDGPALCRMFNRAIRGPTTPKYLSADNDPWVSIPSAAGQPPSAGGDGIKTVPYVPLSHPFVERLIGTVRRGMPGPLVILGVRAMLIIVTLEIE
jgi:putative transposase